jgi:hypothetical protein
MNIEGGEELVGLESPKLDDLVMRRTRKESAIK